MAQRSTGAEVKAIIDTELTVQQVQPFIAAATVFIDETLLGQGYSAGLLLQIEIWLSAHLVAVRDRRVASETVGDVSASYDGKTGMGLEATLYGQQVLMLDHSGKLAAVMAHKRIAEVKVIA